MYSLPVFCMRPTGMFCNRGVLHSKIKTVLHFLQIYSMWVLATELTSFGKEKLLSYLWSHLSIFNQGLPSINTLTGQESTKVPTSFILAEVISGLLEIDLFSGEAHVKLINSTLRTKVQNVLANIS